MDLLQPESGTRRIAKLVDIKLTDTKPIDPKSTDVKPTQKSDVPHLKLVHSQPNHLSPPVVPRTELGTDIDTGIDIDYTDTQAVLRLIETSYQQIQRHKAALAKVDHVSPQMKAMERSLHDALNRLNQV